jgi:hypothetical protein
MYGIISFPSNKAMDFLQPSLYFLEEFLEVRFDRID